MDTTAKKLGLGWRSADVGPDTPSEVATATSPRRHDFLPDFCANRTVFLIVLAAELLAFVLAISGAGNRQSFWLDLALYSLFIQWVALVSAMVLCALGRARWLGRASVPLQTLLVYLCTQAITLLTSLAAQGLTADQGWRVEHYYGLFRNLAVSSIVTLVLLRYFYIQQQWKLNIRAETEARFKSLQARIRPHFLFNSMNTIASLIYQQPRQAEQAVLDLCDLFRSNLRQRDRINLDEELELARRYLNIEQCRLGSRLRVSWRLPEELPQGLIPALILQPLLENAVYYGVEPSRSGGVLEVLIETPAGGRRLRVVVSNSLPAGLAPTHGRQRRGSGYGIALDNIRQRLALAYGEEARLQVDRDAERYRVTLTLPLRQERA